MPIKFPHLYYREFGLRKPTQLMSPRIINVTDLPRESIFHYISEDIENCNIDPSLPLFNLNGVMRIMTDYVTELKSEEGSPRRIAFQLQPQIRPFHKKFRKFKLQKDAAINNLDGKILSVINYSYLYKSYAYVQNQWADYNRWLNIQKTMFENANELCSKSTFNHYFFFDVPRDVPARSVLMNACRNFSIGYLKIFDTVGERLALELWKWLDPEFQANSIFNIFEQKNLNKINFIFRSFSGKMAVLNLGYLYSWIDGHPNMTPIKSMTTKRPQEIAKAMIVFFMIMNSMLDEATDAELIPEETSEPTLAPVLSADEQEMQDELNEEEGVDRSQASSLVIRAKSNEIPGNVEIINTFKNADIKEGSNPSNKPSNKKDEKNKPSDDINFDQEQEHDVPTFDDIDKILEVLEKTNKMRMKQRGLKVDEEQTNSVATKDAEVAIEVEHEIFSRPENTHALKRKIDSDVEYGVLSAADLRKITKDIEAYETMPDPYGSGKTIKEAKVIAPQELKLDDAKIEIKSSKLVKDESLKKSTLISFEEDYTKNVLKKDMLSVVDSLQRGGIIVRDYQVEEVNTILGSYEVHSVELKPIDGAASTIHFRVPKVNREGVFVSNGNSYKLRHQRRDVPIRKINPTTVGLSSYYGKTFVELDPRKANSEISYITNKIMLASFDQTSKVKKVAPASIFDSDFKAPFIYSVLSTSFRIIQLPKHLLDFDHTSRETYVEEGSLAKYEKNGAVVCGYSSDRNPVIVDLENHFWEVTAAGKTDLGNIYDLCGIERVSAPVEYAYVKVLNKEVPVGVYLSYFVGFTRLIKFLKASYRVVPPRKQKDLKENEYAIVFNDGSYIFDRNERKNALILGGFQTLEKQLKRLDVAELDSKDAYLNLLSSKKMSNIHFKEMDSCQDYFIDPITLEILQEMKEPTTFNGLLIRACELLLTYYHPKSQDLDYMRFAGYERFAGFAYGAITQAIRSYKNRNISGKAKIEISPYEVWNTIVKDESVKIIEDINPIQNLKEKEVVTFTGAGGRSKDTMPMEARAYHKSDIGVISEANIDSGDSGINIYLAPNAQIASLRGLKDKTTPEQDKNILSRGSSTVLSTSGLLAPLTNFDD